MEVGLLLFTLTGVALAVPSIPEQEGLVQQKPSRLVIPAAALSVPMKYSLLLEQATDVKADVTLSSEDRQQKITAIRQQLGRVIHQATGVPKELLFNRQPNPAAESLRRQFITEVDGILKSTTADDQQKKLGISLARGQFRQAMEAAAPGTGIVSPANDKEEVRKLGTRISEDLKSAMRDVMKEFLQRDAGRRMEMMRDMKKGFENLKKQFTKE